MSIHRVLVADDEESMRWVLSKAFQRKGCDVDVASDGQQALGLIRTNSYDLAVLDIKMPGMNGLDLLDKIREMKTELLVVIMTAEASMKNAVEAMKRGAYDYITKPFDLDVIDAIIEKVNRSQEISGQLTQLKQELKELYHVEKNIIGKSDAMREVYKTIGKVAGSDVTVLVQGESGTGKELVARAIHGNSNRISKPFIAINCAAIPKELLESELFGSERGAFTGATERKLGKFEQANHGTLFLDEIGDMPLDLQAKILRVLQEREITRTGGNQTIPVNVRIVAATNQELAEKVRQKEFREDLYYRLNVVPINLVPLRERRDDIPELVEYFIGRICTEMKMPVKRCTEGAMAALMGHSWPGNVRELRNTVEKMVVMTRGVKLTARDIPPNIRDATRSRPSEGGFQVKVTDGTSSIASAEKSLIAAALKRYNGNRTKAAKDLGISRRTLHRKLKEYGEDDASSQKQE